MRFVEFQGAETFALLLKNLIGRSGSKKQPANLNWASVNQMLQSTGQGQIDYDGFKAMYDTSPLIQKLVANFNAQGIQLNVPGTNRDKMEPGAAATDVDKSKENVNKVAAANAMNQISS